MEDKTTRHTITVEPGGEEFQCREDQHLLEALKAVGRRLIPSGCHGGGCGVCRIRIIGGEADFKVMSRRHVTEDDRREGIALACRTLPRSDMRVEKAPRPPVWASRTPSRGQNQSESGIQQSGVNR